MHTLICVIFSLPPRIRGWLRLLLVALPGLFCLPFCVDSVSAWILLVSRPSWLVMRMGTPSTVRFTRLTLSRSWFLFPVSVVSPVFVWFVAIVISIFPFWSNLALPSISYRHTSIYCRANLLFLSKDMALVLRSRLVTTDEKEWGNVD